MEFRILGPLEVVGRVGERRALPGGRVRRLLAMLIVNVGEVVPTERLLDELWASAPPATADKALQGLVSKLRKALAEEGGGLEDVVETRPPGYRLAVEPQQVDAERFRRLVRESCERPTAERASGLRGALELWRGRALGEFAHEPFAQAAIASLEEIRLGAIEQLVEAELASGRHVEVAGDLATLVAEHPFRERLREYLMIALYRSGRQADALDAYRCARRTLVDELGVEPSPRLQRLERAILAHHPSLDLDVDTPGQRALQDEPRFVARSWLTETRQVVTVLFAELRVHTPFSVTAVSNGEVESLRPALLRAHELATDAIRRQGGTIEGCIGGVLVAVFGVPRAREDDAWRAVRAAAALGEALAAMTGPDGQVRVTTRIGISSGEVVLGEPDIGATAAGGMTVQLADRLLRSAGDGQLLVSDTTRRLVGEDVAVEPVELTADGEDDVRAWRVTHVPRAVPSFAPDVAIAMVGRTRELEALRRLLDTVALKRRAGLCTVVGEAGIGKSRLALEFRSSLDAGVRVLTGRCPSYGEGVTFWPLRELLDEAVGDGLDAGALAGLLGDGPDAENVAATIAAAVGLEVVALRTSNLLPAAQRLFTQLASAGPLVIVLEDVHWADPTFLDLIRDLQGTLREPVLFLCLARPELLVRRRSWPTTGARITAIELGPLGRQDSERLVADRLQGRTLRRGLRDRIVDLARGNPLFLEQFVAAAFDTPTGGAAVEPVEDLGGVGAETVPVPTSLRTLLVARMMRLGPAERDVLRSAAVVGARFTTDAVTILVPEPVRPFVRPHLESLVERDFLRSAARAGAVAGSTFEFTHALVRQAAYHSLTHRQRAELHQRIADWRARTADIDEVVGYHPECAHREARVGGARNDMLEDLACRAGVRLGEAGLRAFGRVDFGAADNLLSRARALLPAGHELRTEVLRRLVAASPAMGRFESAESALGELLDELPADATDERRRVRLERLRIRMIKGPDPWRHKAFVTVGQQVLADAIAAGDRIAASQANYLLSFVHWRSGRIQELEATARAAVEHAAASGDLRELTEAMWWPPTALVEGPTPVADALAACERLMVEHGSHPGVLTSVSELRAMAGDIALARDLSDRAREAFAQRLHVRRALVFVASRRAHVEILAGALDVAESVLRDTVDDALEVGDRDQIAKVAAGLAWLAARRGTADEARSFLTIADEHAPLESVEASARRTIARARIQSVDGEVEEAVTLVRTTLAKIPDPLLNLRADLYLALAAALAATGETTGSTAALEEARRLYQQKGNVSGLRRLDDELRPAPA